MTEIIEEKKHFQTFSRRKGRKSDVHSEKHKSISAAKLKALSKPKHRPPVLGRKNVISEREWWRKEIKDTPEPGAYDIPTFVDDLHRKQQGYSFKTESREKRLPLILEYSKSGQQLLPGAYDKEDFLDVLQRSRRTYSFKSVDREKNANIGVYDKEVDTNPAQYEIADFAIHKEPSRHAAFKSVIKRFPPVPFRPAYGPGPGEYQIPEKKSNTSCVSSFRSTIPRLSSSSTKVPGPGSYLQTYQDPNINEIERSKGVCGSFFHTIAPSKK
ncbi:Uncharacterized protein C2orf61-like protein [Trichoplax sp. H2]|nr:Uncharacterized protein C2orf61-like protein [Trichoplax sp. H2]|eukprot:RDD42975.1 Uncharacterized protein C2orf61-like protein [Trichoplax sp. H2]